jgi:transcription antitermination factor NusG
MPSTLAPSRKSSAVSAQLSPDVSSVAEIQGDFSIARVRSGTEDKLAEWLSDHGNQWYTPRELVRRYYRAEKNSDRLQSKTWSRAFIPGVVFVGNGWDGRECAAVYGNCFSNRLYNFIGPVYDDAHGGQRLRRELLQIEGLLGIDPTLSAHSGIRVGHRVAITDGAFKGMVGPVEKTAGGRVWIRMETLSSLLQIDVGFLERSD